MNGLPLEGQMYLEVPVQKAIPNKILDHATKKDVFIRDTAGKIYNP